MPRNNNTTKRKDSKGRVLRTGESQRKDGTYDFRYMDSNHKRRSIYAMTLEDLRRKEDELTTCKTMGAEDCTTVEDLRKKEAEAMICAIMGIDLSKGHITVIELVERYVKHKRNVRAATQTGYRFVLGVLHKYAFGDQVIRDIKVSDAKDWLIQLFDDGYSWNSIASIRSVVKPAFQMAFTEEIIRRNPFDFRLDFLPNNSQKRVALTQRQQKQFLDFIAQDEHYCKYLDEIVVLLGTGMRISEFCGLTMKDLDFENRKINVDHQLVWDRNCKRYIEKTKTDAGCRYIPMDDNVMRSLCNILQNRPKPKKEWMVDGYTGFLLLDQNGSPKVALHLEHVVTRIWEKYNEENIIPLPKITPHVFRHTFCTNLANAGMDLKSLQYLMGHSDVSVTLNVYTHTEYEKAQEAMSRICSFTDIQMPGKKKRKLG